MPSNGNPNFVATREQQQAIEHVHGPMLVVAGAGTGKTTVLSRRIAHLIQSGAARPDEILAVTYTRNAAAELIARVAAILYQPEHPQASLYPEIDRQRAAQKLLRSGLQAHTFHSYCYRLLNVAGTKFQLLDDKDLFVLLRRHIGEMKLQHYLKAAVPGKFLGDLLKFFSSCHDELRTPADYDKYVTQLERGEIPLPRMAKSRDAQVMSDDEVLARCREVAGAFRFAEKLLHDEGLGTFGHIMTRAVDVLTRRSSVLERARRRARFILIDEFQDSNLAQIRLASLLAGDEANVFAVGDPDQAIYQFRGATSAAFDQFLSTFGAQRVKRVTMSENRRSTPPILSCAYEIIKSNPNIVSVDPDWKREPLTCARLRTDANLKHAPAVQAIAHGSEQDAVFVADQIESMRRTNADLEFKDFAVLYRSHFCREQVVGELTRRGIPIRVKGADLMATPELRDAMAVLRVLDGSNPVALFRVAALPQFQIDPACFRAELALLRETISPEAALANVPGGEKVLGAIHSAQAELIAREGNAAAALSIAQRVFQLTDSMPLRRLCDFVERWQKKPNQIAGKGTLHEFIDYLALFREAGGALVEETDEDDPVAALEPGELAGKAVEDAVTLMTVHAAKGLEFRCVFVIRVASQTFPSGYKECLVEFPQQLRAETSLYATDPKTLHEREERRLFYVAMTRAMDDLFVCGKAGTMRGEPAPPSKYLRELVTAAKTNPAIHDALAYRLLLPEVSLRAIHAGADEPLLNVSQWTQLSPRADDRPLELSASAIDQYERCPLAYKLRYDWRLPDEATAALQFGNAMHLALKAYYDGVRAGRPPDVETVVACFLDEFAKAKIDEPLQRALYEESGRRQLPAFLASSLASANETVIDTERRFKIEAGGTHVKGRFDRIDRLANGEVEIFDYKTGNPKTLEDAGDSLQLSIYALAATKMGLKPSSLVFVNLQNTTAVGSGRSEEQLRAAEAKIASIAACIAEGQFEPKTGSGCFRCSYNSICPTQEQPLPRVTREQAAAVV